MNLKPRNIPFSPPDMSEAEAKLASEAILSGWITTGPKTKEFERQIASYIGTKKAVCLNSATAAMEMALRLIGVGPEDEVIVPAYTYTAEGGALVWNLPFGEEPVKYDAWTTVPPNEGETWNAFLYRLSMLYSLHGQNKDALAKTQLGSWEYDVIGPWYKCNMTDIMAGIGLAQLSRYQGMLERRRQIIGVYDNALNCTQPL